MADRKLIVALGNPGPEYARTRHNAGWMLLDRWQNLSGIASQEKNKFSGAFIDGMVLGKRVMTLKPMTFMNRSGQAVSEAVNFYKLDPVQDLLVLVDDLALHCGQLKFKPGGGTNGHNGLKDIQQKLSTPNYARLKIGIDPRGHTPQVDYVLGTFRPDQQDHFEDACNLGCTALDTWLKEGLDAAMNRFN